MLKLHLYAPNCYEDLLQPGRGLNKINLLFAVVYCFLAVVYIIE